MGRKRKTTFVESALMNNRTYIQYYNRLTELALSMFEWTNLPKTVDARFLEMCLFSEGKAVFFKDKDLGYIGLQCAISGRLNVYRIPINRRAYASNGYNKDLTDKDSVIIYNNFMHTNSKLDVEMFSKRLYNLDRIIDVNANAQKTPVLIKCSEEERMTMLNLYKDFDGNAPVIFGESDLNTNGLTVLKTEAPYVADQIYQLKTQIWNEALTYLGISNINTVKKERLITDEAIRNNGGTVASRYSRLEARRQACKQINEMFGLDIWCNFREDYRELDGEVDVEDNNDTERSNENE
ncbi:MAG: hypothetical protein J6L69_03035 [Lachnospiraceae bacterium]|nr:hypothetical protein [Lachnospiraceae bacterium]